VEESGETFAPEPRRYLFEVGAAGDSEYELAFPWQLPEAMVAMATARVDSIKPLPQHPLAVADPLSAGQLGPQDTGNTKIYLPALMKP
jgi:hypothetical protein